MPSESERPRGARYYLDKFMPDPPTEQERCRRCGGTGREITGPGAQHDDCPRCHGTGIDPPTEQVLTMPSEGTR